MHLFKKMISLWMAGILVLTWVCPRQAHALTIKEEQELADEFLKAVRQTYEICDDPVIQKYVNHVGNKILSAFPPQPFEYHFDVVRQDSFNAFAGPAGNIFIHSGLFLALDNEDELAGLLAHEIAHAYCRHISDLIEKSKTTSIATLAGVAAGILMGLGGASAVGSALTIGSVAAGQTVVLAYTRENEMQADQIGRMYLEKSGYQLSALLSVLKKIRSTEFYDSKEIPTYLKTHPATEDRIIYLDTLLEDKEKPAVKPTPDFIRAKYRLMALYGNRDKVLQTFQEMMAKDPGNVMAQYGYGLALEKGGTPKAAIPYLKNAQAASPQDPYLINDLGRIYFLSGEYENALNILQNSPSLRDGGPDGYLYLGQAQLQVGRNQEAADSFSKLVSEYPDNLEAKFFLGRTLGELGKLNQAHYYLGLFYVGKRDPRTAMFHLQKALELETDEAQKAKIKTAIEDIKKDKDMREELRGGGRPR